MDSLASYLLVSSILFSLGLYGVVTRRNGVAVLMSIELILNAVNINFVAFNKYLYPENMQGHFFSMFIIGIAAAEAAVAIAIIINIYRNIQNIDVENIDQMKY